MLHKIRNGRKICVFGKNPFELITAAYDLFFGKEKISEFVYHKPNEVKDLSFNVKNFEQFAFQSDKYFFVVADNDNYEEIRKILISNGYEPVKDFVQFKPATYKKVWKN